MKNSKGLSFLFILILLVWNMDLIAQSNSVWSKKKATKWFKTQEWLNGKNVGETQREYDSFGREIFESQIDSDSIKITDNESLQLKPHRSINKEEFAKQYHTDKLWWDKAFAFLKETDLIAIKPGKYFIDNDNVFATVTEGSAKLIDTTKWESHRNYQDIHYVISGKEQIGIANISSLTVTNEYNLIKDLIFYSGKGKYYIAEPGTFFIFFPQDAHRPNLQLNGYAVKKVVIKIRRG